MINELKIIFTRVIYFNKYLWNIYAFQTSTKTGFWVEDFTFYMEKQIHSKNRKGK